MKIYAQLNALRAINHLSATKDIRFYLKGVLVEATKTHTTLVATDGHVLGVYKNEEENEIPENVKYEFILPNDALKNVKPFIKEELISFEFEPDDHGKVNTVIIKTFSITLSTRTIDERFADWRRVLPRETTKELGDYNPVLLTRFIKAAKEFGIKPWKIKLHQNGLSAAAITFYGIENFLGVVMPLRSDSVYTGCVYTGCDRFLDEQLSTQEALAA
jgi:hypothetical protein